MTIQQIDLRLLLWCVQLYRTPFWVLLAKAVSRSGDGYMQLCLPLALWWFAGPAAEPLIATLVLAFAIERPIYWLLKNTLKRRRPPEAIPAFDSLVIASDRFSFPSGHTAAAFLFALVVYCYFPWLGMGLFVWAGMVGMSRVILGVHFPTDIIAGAALGLSIGLWLTQDMVV